jgi:hypothetical protein
VRSVFYSGHEETALAVNTRVNVISAKDGRLPGTVRFVGLTAFAVGTWIGVALDAPAGKNDGSVAGRRYFDCAPEHGLFVKEEAVERIATPTVPESAHSASERDSVSDASLDTPTLSHSEAASSSEKRAGTITGVLKLKLAQMMEMLNHQLEIVVELEDEDRKRGAVPGYSKRALELHGEILGITNKEQNLIAAFKQHLTERLLPRDS